jgi:peptidoglycan/LPS O-acetylase OafA/YrhL
MINNLQVLRAVAALNIVFYHAFGIGQSYGYHADGLDPLVEWSGNGVDIFFVISGFVMFYTQHLNPKRPLDFLKSRIKRVVPLYWSITLGCIGLILAAPLAFRQASFDVTHSLTSLFFISHLAGFKYPVLVPGWTLELEMLFYVLFATALLLPRLNLIATVTFFLCIAMALFDLDLLVLEFVLGMVAAHCYIKDYFRRAGWLLFGCGVAALTADIFVDAELNRLLTWGVPAFMLVLGSCYIRQVGRGVWVLLGSASYGIYLIHTMTLPIFYKLIRWMGVSGHGLVADLQLLVCVGFSAVVGLLTYRFYERPLARIL